MEDALEFLVGLPQPLIYVSLSLGAAIENVFPIVPADTFIATGGFLAGLGTVDPIAVFVAIWLSNVLGAIAVYWVGARHGLRFFAEGKGRFLLSVDQLERLDAFYDRWGVLAIFTARFLPGFRALVPVFAGVTGQHPVRVVPPILIASFIWYGALVRLGFVAGDNLDAALATLASTNRRFLVASLGIAVILFWFWWRGRKASKTVERGPDDP